MSLLASLFGHVAPLGMSALFGAPDPYDEYQKLLSRMRFETSGARASVVHNAAQRAAALAQNFQSAVGQTGQGRTGGGAAARGLATSYAGSESSRAAMDFDAQLSERAATLAGSGQFTTPNAWRAVAEGLAPAYGGGGNPIGEVFQMGMDFFRNRSTPASLNGVRKKPAPDRYEYFTDENPYSNVG